MNYAAEEFGFNTLGRLLDAVPQFQSAALATRRSWAEKNRPLMVRFMKGMVQSLHWMHNNKDATVEFLAKEIQLKPALALKGWEYYTQNRIWPYDGEPNIEGMKHNIRVYYEQTGAKAPVPDVFKFVEMSYLNRGAERIGQKIASNAPLVRFLKSPQHRHHFFRAQSHRLQNFILRQTARSDVEHELLGTHGIDVELDLLDAVFRRAPDRHDVRSFFRDRGAGFFRRVQFFKRLSRRTLGTRRF